MEGHKFDAMVKVLGTTGARRRLLAGVLGTGLAGLLGSAGAAARLDNGEKCARNAECRSAHCCKRGGRRRGICRECCTNRHCAAPQTCGGGGTANDCGCTPDCAGKCGGAGDGCGGTCTDDCPAGQGCVGTVCVCTPDCAGKLCGDSDGCGGACPGDCPEGRACVENQCVLSTCTESNRTPCDAGGGQIGSCCCVGSQSSPICDCCTGPGCQLIVDDANNPSDIRCY